MRYHHQRSLFEGLPCEIFCAVYFYVFVIKMFRNEVLSICIVFIYICVCVGYVDRSTIWQYNVHVRTNTIIWLLHVKAKVKMTYRVSVNLSLVVHLCFYL